jgi:hypothetical protein
VKLWDKMRVFLINHSSEIIINNEFEIDRAIRILREVIKGKETFSFFDNLFDLN